MKHTDEPPTINHEQVASDFGPYRHVVLEVAEGDTNALFAKPGYYYVIGLSPEECERLLGLGGPTS